MAIEWISTGAVGAGASAEEVSATDRTVGVGVDGPARSVAFGLPPHPAISAVMRTNERTLRSQGGTGDLW